MSSPRRTRKEADVPEPLDGIEALAEVDDLADDTPEEDEA